jgi:hypothetical protein
VGNPVSERSSRKRSTAARPASPGRRCVLPVNQGRGRYPGFSALIEVFQAGKELSPLLLQAQHPEAVQHASDSQPVVVGKRPDPALPLERRAGIDPILLSLQPDEFQEPVERTEEVVAERWIGAECRHVFLGQQGSVRVVLAGLTKREEPLDEVVVVLHLLITEVPDLGEGSPFAIGRGSPVEFDQARHDITTFTVEDGSMVLRREVGSDSAVPSW